MKSNNYQHIESFKDFENEKIKLYFQIKLVEKKLELRYLELGNLLNPMRVIPMLFSQWMTPISSAIKGLVSGFLNKYSEKQTN